MDLKDLVNLYEKVSGRLYEEFDYYNIMACADNWNKAVAQKDGSIHLIPYRSAFTDTVKLYNEVKRSMDEQIEHLKEVPQLQAYLGVCVNKETGVYSNVSDSYIADKLYNG